MKFNLNDKLTLTSSSSRQLKGVAILLVLIGHLCIQYSIKAPFLYFAGAEGVALFLILSGYGLTVSYLKKGISKDFIYKRLTTVMLPYMIVTALWILIDTHHYGKRIIILSLLGFDPVRTIDPTMWYISFIMLWYLFFYLIFKLPINNIFKLALLIAVSYLFRNHSLPQYTQQLSYQWNLSAYVFPIGVFIALYIDKLHTLAGKASNALILIIGLSSLVSYCINIKNNILGMNYYSASNITFALFAIVLFMSLANLNIKIKFLEFIGDISYEIYLFEGVFLWKYNFMFKLQGKALSITAYIVFTILCSVILKKLLAYAPKSIKLSNVTQ